MKPDRYTAMTTERAMQAWKELAPFDTMERAMQARGALEQFNTTPKKLCVDCSAFKDCPTYIEVHPYAIACLLFHTSGKVVVSKEGVTPPTVLTSKMLSDAMEAIPSRYGDNQPRRIIPPTRMPSSGTKVTR
jgi:hypothetical protein